MGPLSLFVFLLQLQYLVFDLVNPVGCLCWKKEKKDNEKKKLSCAKWCKDNDL